MDEVANFMDQSMIRSDMKIHQWLDNLFTILVFGDLNGKKRIHADQTEIETIASYRAVVRVDSRVRTVGVDRVTPSSSSRETKGKTESRAEFQSGTIGIWIVVRASTSKAEFALRTIPFWLSYTNLITLIYQPTSYCFPLLLLSVHHALVWRCAFEYFLYIYSTRITYTNAEKNLTLNHCKQSKGQTIGFRLNVSKYCLKILQTIPTGVSQSLLKVLRIPLNLWCLLEEDSNERLYRYWLVRMLSCECVKRDRLQTRVVESREGQSGRNLRQCSLVHCQVQILGTVLTSRPRPHPLLAVRQGNISHQH